MAGRSSIALSLSAALLVIGCDSSSEPDPAPVADSPAEQGMGIDRSHAGTPIPDLEIGNGEGEPAMLSAETGEPILVNLWATWCAPCVKELPTLEALGSRAGAPRVIAVSQDMAPRGSVDAFIEKQRLSALEVWHDPDMEISAKLGAQILPTTILYDPQGREVWRYVGDLDWTGEEAARLLSEPGAG